MDKFNLREYLKNNPLLKEADSHRKLTREEVNDLYNEYPEIENPSYEGKELIDHDEYGENATFKITVYEDYETYGTGGRVKGVYEVFSDSMGDDDWWEWGDDHYKDRKEIDENKTLNELELDFYDEDDPNAVTLTAQSGEYDGDVEDGIVSFSVYDEYEEFDEDNWEDILGSNHAFSQISNKIPTKVEADGDYVQITVKIDDLKGIAK